MTEKLEIDRTGPSEAGESEVVIVQLFLTLHEAMDIILPGLVNAFLSYFKPMLM